MAGTSTDMAARIGRLCRNVAVAVIAGVFRRRSIEDIDRTVKARPIRQQILITAGVLGILFGLSLVAAQFGWIGMLVFWLGVVVMIN